MNDSFQQSAAGLTGDDAIRRDGYRLTNGLAGEALTIPSANPRNFHQAISDTAAMPRQDLWALKRSGRRLTMCNPASPTEIQACVDAGIDALTVWDVLAGLRQLRRRDLPVHVRHLRRDARPAAPRLRVRRPEAAARADVRRLDLIGTSTTLYAMKYIIKALMAVN